MILRTSGEKNVSPHLWQTRAGTLFTEEDGRMRIQYDTKDQPFIEWEQALAVINALGFNARLTQTKIR